MTHFRIKYENFGSHVNARFFSSSRLDSNYVRNGELKFTSEEWRTFRQCFSDYGKNTVTVLPAAQNVANVS